MQHMHERGGKSSSKHATAMPDMQPYSPIN